MTSRPSTLSNASHLDSLQGSSKVTFDSNAWEAIFSDSDTKYEPLRHAMKAGQLSGFICATAFRIEAVRKTERGSYFSDPHADLRIEGVVERDGQRYIKMSFGPADEQHPGLPPVQTARLQTARQHGFRLLRGLAWMGLPSPPQIADLAFYAEETKEGARKREQQQIDVSTLIEARGVGRAPFLAAGGWNTSMGTLGSQKRFAKACAEWSDGEMVCAHIAYRNHVLCTNDQGGNAGNSIFDPTNRAWLQATFGTVVITLDNLLSTI